MFENRYRAKQDMDGNVRVQVKYWYFPFMWQHVRCVGTLAKAKAVVDCLRQEPIEL